jgi:hypothetical protein
MGRDNFSERRMALKCLTRYENAEMAQKTHSIASFCNGGDDLQLFKFRPKVLLRTFNLRLLLITANVSHA